MLSAFTARSIVELKSRDRSKIETILAYGDRLLVGLNSGALHIYRVNELPPLSAKSSDVAKFINRTSLRGAQVGGIKPSKASPAASNLQNGPPTEPGRSVSATKPTDLLREVDRFSSRAIEQLAIIKEANTLVSLSNYTISLHDLQTFEPLDSPLPRTKNASTFAVTSNIVKDSTSNIPEIISRLAVAVKRRLLLWSWHDGEVSQEVKEIMLPESIRSITWANATKMVCGMNSGYVMVDVTSNVVEDIVGPGAIGGAAGGQSRFGAVSSAGMGYMGLGGYTPRPLSARLAEGELLLAKDINTLFINDSGKAMEKRQIPWQAAPEGIGYSYPYILALQAPTKGGVEVRNPDTLSLLQVISLPGAAALHFSPPTMSLAHAGKGFHVLSDRVVWKMDATDYDSQIDELVRGGKFDEAISILNMLEDALLKNKLDTLREVMMLKAELLFKKKKYQESLDLFNDAKAPPQRVLKLFPRIISGELSELMLESVETCDTEESNGSAVVEKSVKSETAEPSSLPKGGGFARYLLGHRKLDVETTSVASTKKEADEEGTASSKEVRNDGFEDEKDLKEAVSGLFSYLVGARTNLQKVIDPEIGRLRPPKTLSSNSEEGFRTLLASSSEHDHEQMEKEVLQTCKIVDTALFRAYMYSRPSLASSLFRIHNFCDPDVVHQSLVEHKRVNELVDFFYGKKLHRKALDLLRRYGSPDQADESAKALHGPYRTVLYLQNLPPELVDLILEYSEWTLRKDSKVGMEVFLADSANAETLPRDRVADFLHGIDVHLEMQYLDHIITELDDRTPAFHDRLVELLITRLKETREQGGEEWDEHMRQLIRLLRASGQYSFGQAFRLLPLKDPLFYEAQVVVLSNIGSHKQALELYVFEMKDYTKAEEYCNRIHKTQECAKSPASSGGEREAGDVDESAERSIYHTLLSLYLTPPRPHSPNLTSALDLLSKHGCRLPAASTLSLIPDTLPVANLESYFRGRMRSANSVFNETRVVAGLRRTELVASQAFLLLGDGLPGSHGGRNRRVVVNEERVCGHCHRRLGASVVAVMPDDEVMHYGCLNKPQSGSGILYPSAQVGSWGRSGASVGRLGVS